MFQKYHNTNKPKFLRNDFKKIIYILILLAKTKQDKVFIYYSPLRHLFLKKLIEKLAMYKTNSKHSSEPESNSCLVLQ